jgi:hypothetical protein
MKFSCFGKCALHWRFDLYMCYGLKLYYIREKMCKRPDSLIVRAAERYSKGPGFKNRSGCPFSSPCNIYVINVQKYMEVMKFIPMEHTNYNTISWKFYFISLIPCKFFQAFKPFSDRLRSKKTFGFGKKNIAKNWLRNHSNKLLLAQMSILL